MPSGAHASITAPIGFQRPQAKREIRSAAIIGNFPPRMCGIATFTKDLLAGLIAASPNTRWTTVAMSDQETGYAFAPAFSHVIRQGSREDYVAVSDALN